MTALFCAAQHRSRFFKMPQNVIFSFIIHNNYSDKKPTLKQYIVRFEQVGLLRNNKKTLRHGMLSDNFFFSRGQLCYLITFYRKTLLITMMLSDNMLNIMLSDNILSDNIVDISNVIR
jgi:hypothetical protein